MVIFKFSILICTILMIYSHRAFSTEPTQPVVRDGQVFQLSPEQMERINQEMGSGAIDEYGFPIRPRRRAHEHSQQRRNPRFEASSDEQLWLSGRVRINPHQIGDSDDGPLDLDGFSAGRPHDTQGLPRDYHDDLHDDNDYTAVIKKVWKF